MLAGRIRKTLYASEVFGNLKPSKELIVSIDVSIPLALLMDLCDLKMFPLLTSDIQEVAGNILVK